MAARRWPKCSTAFGVAFCWVMSRSPGRIMVIASRLGQRNLRTERSPVAPPGVSWAPQLDTPEHPWPAPSAALLHCSYLAAYLAAFSPHPNPTTSRLLPTLLLMVVSDFKIESVSLRNIRIFADRVLCESDWRLLQMSHSDSNSACLTRPGDF